MKKMTKKWDLEIGLVQKLPENDHRNLCEKLSKIGLIQNFLTFVKKLAQKSTVNSAGQQYCLLTSLDDV